MTYPSRVSQYREIQVMSASPARLTVLLFEHLEVVMRRAQTAMRNEQVELRVENMGKARAIVSELLTTLDIDNGGAIAIDLSMLYGFLLAEMVDVGIRRDAMRLSRLIGIVNTLGTAFADALSAGAAAGSRKVPVLLTSPGALPAATADELRRLRPASITILGGANAVSAAVEAALRPLSSGAVTRVSGVDRYATSAAVSKDAFSAAKTVYLATGAGFPDALAGIPAAGRDQAPLLLVEPSCMPAASPGR